MDSEKRKELIKTSINMFIVCLHIRRIIDYIEWSNWDINQITGFWIPRFRRCRSCGKFILFNPWIKTYSFKKKYVYFHEDCFQKLAESFNNMKKEME